jgi:hypothetical protein
VAVALIIGIELVSVFDDQAGRGCPESRGTSAAAR